DPTITMYAEDLDLSWRARLAGYVVRYIPTSIVGHHYSGSSGVFNPTKNRLGTTHFIAVLIKCLSRHNLIHSLIGYTAYSILKGMTLAIAERNAAYITNVFVAITDTVRRLPVLRAQRRETQSLRVAPDHVVLRSEGFGL